MLVYTRKDQEKIIIERIDSNGNAQTVTIEVSKPPGERLKFAVDAPKEIKIK